MKGGEGGRMGTKIVMGVRRCTLRGPGRGDEWRFPGEDITSILLHSLSLSPYRQPSDGEPAL